MQIILNIINYFCVGSSLLLAFLLIVNPQKVNKKANAWFGVFIFCIFWLLFGDILIANKLFPRNEYWILAMNFPNFILAPIFYLSVTYYINPTKKWRNKNLLLFPFAFFIIGLNIFVKLVRNPGETDEKFFPPWFFIAFGIVFSLQLIPYFYLSYRKIIKHQKNIKLFSSTLENVDLKWLEYMIIGSLVMAAFWIANILLKPR